MTLLNFWNLDRLLEESHPAGTISGILEARNEKYAVQLKTSRLPEQGDFTCLSAEIKMRRVRENMFSAQQVHQLATQYGGDKHLRIMLHNGLFETPGSFFDISIDEGKIYGDENSRTLRLPSGEFTPRPLLRDLCRILYLRFEERMDRFYLFQEQQPILNPNTVKEAYQRMKRTEYFPSLASSSANKGFEVFQFPAPPDGMDQVLSLQLGDQFLNELPLNPADRSLLQRTLLEYCPVLPKLKFTWKTETAGED